MTKWDDNPEVDPGPSWAPISDNDLTMRLAAAADRERKIENITSIAATILLIGLIVIFLAWLAKVVLF